MATEVDKEKSSISRYNGNECIMLSVTKCDGNTVSVVNSVQSAIEQLNKEYPQLKIDVIDESASTISDLIDNVISNIFIGAFLPIIVLFVFLKNIGCLTCCCRIYADFHYRYICTALFFRYNT